MVKKKSTVLGLLSFVTGFYTAIAVGFFSYHFWVILLLYVTSIYIAMADDSQSRSKANHNQVDYKGVKK